MNSLLNERKTDCVQRAKWPIKQNDIYFFNTKREIILNFNGAREKQQQRQQQQ